MDKASWRLRTMRRQAQDALRTSRSIREAARRIDVAPSTLSRAIRRGELLPPGRVPQEAAAVLSASAAEGVTFSEWVQEAYELSRPELELLTLAQAALNLSRDPATPRALQLQAMGRFQSIVKDLALPKEQEHGAIETPIRAFHRA